MSLSSFYEHHTLNEAPAIRAGFNPYYPQLQGGLSDPLRLDGRDFVNLASNNYLGLANDARVVEAAMEGLRHYGVSLCSTPVAAGYSDLFRETEDRLAAFEGLEGALILPSCYQANNGIFRLIAGPDDLIVVDRSAHSSLIEGIKAAGCKIRPFLNNDMNHLEDILKKSGEYPQVFVVTESVFSTEGSIAPFREINVLCERYNAVPVIDDSHGIGVIGARGRGILEYAGITDFQGIYLASLGKAMASMGGMIGGKRSLMHYLRFSMPHLLYSTAIVPSALKATLSVMEIIEAEYDQLSTKLKGNTARLRMALKAQGYILTPGDSPIVSVNAGNSEQTLMLSKAMYEHNILGTPFIYPSVPEKEGRMRLIAGAGLSVDSLSLAIRGFAQIKEAMS